MSIVTIFLLLLTVALGLAHAVLWFVETGNRASLGAGTILNTPGTGMPRYLNQRFKCAPLSMAQRGQASGSAGLRAPGKGNALKSERVRILEAYLKTV